MKIAIIYKSVTGNTKKLAEEIKKELSNEEIVYFGEPKESVEADVYFVGSWTDKGTCTIEIQNFLKTLINKKIAIYGTAGFGGSKEYYDKIFNNVKKNISESNEIIGYFYCQGKMPISIKEKYESMLKANPNNLNFKSIIDNFDKALGHPNEKDMEDVRNWICNVRNKF